MANIISYSYPEGTPKEERTVEVTIQYAENRCSIEMVDGGTPFDQTAAAGDIAQYDPTAQIGGAGRLLIANLADDTHYEYRDGKNRFSFTKTINKGE